ncbi:DUF1501 domain-containing protein [Planctomicrobium sp. SH661]|uniref:DUF1501 domain-containing protein n=1 Tax=Planctomicrobium sp. SH661 TaxID=3448124 RepID=UPI003F5C27D5
MEPATLEKLLTRRAVLGRSAHGLGTVALASMLNAPLTAAALSAEKTDRWRGVVDPPHVLPRAKRVIWLYMAGGMSHLETFDEKPLLKQLHGQPMPESVTQGQQIAQLQGQKLNCFAPQHEFQTYGQSGQKMSTIFPLLGQMAADEICIVRSLHGEAINHDPAHTLMNTGSMISGRPSAGAWLNYGLGTETENLPGFVVMISTGKFGQKQPIAARQWHSGFLPSRFQGVEFRSTGDPVLYVSNPQGIDRNRQRDVVRAVQQLNQLENESVNDPEIATRISQYEMAFQMQASVPELMDVSQEPKHILDLYGTQGGDGSFGSNCLLARRLAERGVRFIQLYHRDWDHHGSVKDHSAGTAAEVDRGAAALITDLKQRGMLEDTLIVFGTEFGRTPMAQGNGRDHHIAGFSMWFAGGGIKSGFSYGATDDFGYHAVENKVSINDVHATLMHLMGIDHQQLTFSFQGRNFRLTDVGGKVIQSILA